MCRTANEAFIGQQKENTDVNAGNCTGNERHEISISQIEVPQEAQRDAHITDTNRKSENRVN